MDARIVRSTRYICTVVFVSPVDSLFFAPLRRVLQVSSVPHSDPYPKVTYQVVSPVPRATIAGVRVHHSYTVPGTSVSSVRLPYPYPKSTNPALRQNMTFFFTCRALDSGGQNLDSNPPFSARFFLFPFSFAFGWGEWLGGYADLVKWVWVVGRIITSRTYSSNNSNLFLAHWRCSSVALLVQRTGVLLLGGAHSCTA